MAPIGPASALAHASPEGGSKPGFPLPIATTIRARGFCTGGEYNASSSIVEISAGTPVITSQPANVENFTNRVMALTVVAAGSSPIAYQWFKNNVPIPGATNSAFAVQNSTWDDAGSYRVVVSNGLGQ